MAPTSTQADRPAPFNLPVEQIKQGFFSDAYFVRAREIVRQDAQSPRVTVQVTGKHDGWLGGIDEAIALLKLCADDWSALDVHALYEGDRYEAWDTVLIVEGPVRRLRPPRDAVPRHARAAHARLHERASSSATRRSRSPSSSSARATTCYCDPAGRRTQRAMVGGVKLVSTDAQASLFGGKAVGTIPHALIAAYGGDTRQGDEAIRRARSRAST